MSGSAFSKVSAAALSISIAALVGFLAIEHPDVPLKRAAYDFGWSLPLLAGCIVLDHGMYIAIRREQRPDALVRYARVLCFIAGGAFWLQGITAVLQHLPIPPIQVVLIKAVFCVVLGIALIAVLGGAKKDGRD
ncbi:hypothetical protein WT25_17750 [Burkholderia territorii]|uniref:hypothetical protein n=1 Tax=Burkholderia territorii TaxID=1503055 RepID=UPI000756ACDB|nr:hypothetical protein [Burkholderia territorii]KVT79552.1 hypothetical protein WT25_17750 [Burkholderia territorii]